MTRTATRTVSAPTRDEAERLAAPIQEAFVAAGWREQERLWVPGDRRPGLGESVLLSAEGQNLLEADGSLRLVFATDDPVAPEPALVTGARQPDLFEELGGTRYRRLTPRWIVTGVGFLVWLFVVAVFFLPRFFEAQRLTGGLGGGPIEFDGSDCETVGDAVVCGDGWVLEFPPVSPFPTALPCPEGEQSQEAAGGGPFCPLAEGHTSDPAASAGVFASPVPSPAPSSGVFVSPDPGTSPGPSDQVAVPTHDWPRDPAVEVASYTRGAGGFAGVDGIRVWTLYGDGVVVESGVARRLSRAEMDAWLVSVEQAGLLERRPIQSPECCDLMFSWLSFNVDGTEVRWSWSGLGSAPPAFPLVAPGADAP